MGSVGVVAVGWISVALLAGTCLRYLGIPRWRLFRVIFGGCSDYIDQEDDEQLKLLEDSGLASQRRKENSLIYEFRLKFNGDLLSHWLILDLEQKVLSVVHKENDVSLHKIRLDRIKCAEPLRGQQRFGRLLYLNDEQDKEQSLNLEFASKASAKTFLDFIHSYLYRDRPSNMDLLLYTFNVNDAQPPKDSPLLPQSPLERGGLVAIALQECSKLTLWQTALESTLEEYDFVLVRAVFSWDRALFLFVKREYVCAVANLVVREVYVGVGGLAGNKGAIGMSFSVYDTVFAVVNSHLAAHQAEVARRNSEYSTIAKKFTTLTPSSKDDLFGSPIHFVFWMGDLNYRIDLPKEECLEMIKKRDWNTLLEYDQLRNEQRNNRAFHSLKEGHVLFAPTYKMSKDLDTYTDERSRIPSWCDRVLYHALRGSRLDLLSYSSFPSLRCSDHRPVYAVFRAHLIHTTGLHFRARDSIFSFFHAPQTMVLHLRLLHIRITSNKFGISETGRLLQPLSDSEITTHQEVEQGLTSSDTLIDYRTETSELLRSTGPLLRAHSAAKTKETQSLRSAVGGTGEISCAFFCRCFKRSSGERLPIKSMMNVRESDAELDRSCDSIVEWNHEELPVIPFFETLLESVTLHYMVATINNKNGESVGRGVIWLGSKPNSQGHVSFDEPVRSYGLAVGRISGTFVVENASTNQSARRSGPFGRILFGER